MMLSILIVSNQNGEYCFGRDCKLRCRLILVVVILDKE